MFNITSYSGNNSYLRTANQERHLLLHRWQLMCKTESSNSLEDLGNVKKLELAERDIK